MENQSRLERNAGRNLKDDLGVLQTQGCWHEYIPWHEYILSKLENMMGYTYMGDILDTICNEKYKRWNMMEPIYREFDILWFDMMLPQGREQCTANMNYMSEKIL